MTLPTVNLPIHQLDHPVVAHAQRVPQIDAAGGAARILARVDRVWLKVKTGRHRGGVTTVSPREAVDVTGPVHAPEWLEGWWLGFVGLRKEDSATDVYAVALQRSTVPRLDGGPGVDTTWMLPTPRDARRAVAEFAAHQERAMRDQVLATIVASATSGLPVQPSMGIMR